MMYIPQRTFSITVAIMLLMKLSPLSSQSNSPYADDVTSLDNIMTALYDVISGNAGVKRDWDRFQYLFTDDARLIPSNKKKDGPMGYRILSPQDYVELAGKMLEKDGFIEKEIHQKVERYGSLVHVWSTYESYRSTEDSEPFMRGINSIQLLNDGKRWWIMQIYWLGETEDNPIPSEYLPR